MKIHAEKLACRDFNTVSYLFDRPAIRIHGKYETSKFSDKTFNNALRVRSCEEVRRNYYFKYSSTLSDSIGFFHKYFEVRANFK